MFVVLYNHDHEEADTLLILYGIDVAKNDPFQELIVCSPDTDVFLLLIAFYKSLCTRTLFRTGKGSNNRDIDIGAAYEALGEEKASALIGFHSFTGCDVTSKFFGKSKLSSWKAFTKSPSDVLYAFRKLGEDSLVIPNSVKDALYLFILNLYCPTRPKHVTTIADLRWHLYMKSQVEPEMLPPTQGALDYKIKRSHFVSQIWRKADEAVPIIPNPEEFGWKLKDGVYEAVLTDLSPVPDVVAELSFCKCQTNCNSMRCKCKKNDLTCTEMCSCTNCENNDDNNDNEDLYFDSEDDDL